MTNTQTAKTCREFVGKGFDRGFCGHTVKVTIDGIGYCGIHNPRRLHAIRTKAAVKRQMREEGL
jgi:hypothetical protein